MSISRGKFIVIDGTDGSGKTTQAEILVGRLKKAGFDVEVADFPQYGKKSAGAVEEYLNGKYGLADEVGPYRASIFYAIDRYDASFKIRKWLNEGKIVVSNRYVAANMGHQGGKIADPEKRKIYFQWLDKLEYGIFGIPRPDLNIILHVEAEIAQKLVDNKGHRDYVNGGKRDIHEADLDHLKNAEKVYLEIAEMFPEFKLVECTKNGRIMTRDEISDGVWKAVSGKLILPFRIGAEDDGSSTSVKPAFKYQLISSEAKHPQKVDPASYELSFYSVDSYVIDPGRSMPVKTGIRFILPAGFVGVVFVKNFLDDSFSITEVINSEYNNELAVNIKNYSGETLRIDRHDEVARIILQKIPS